MPKVIDGRAIAEEVLAQVQEGVCVFQEERGRHPGLAVILIGEDAASQVYVRNKARQTDLSGMVSFRHHLPVSTTQAKLLALIQSLNQDERVDGILVQLPLPEHIDVETVLDAISPDKDVDGFHPLNFGKLAAGKPALTPCTPSGCMRLITSVRSDLRGLEALVVGRSNIVGKPMALLLLAAGCTVTIAHSQTRDLAEVCRRADILVAAVGRPGFIRGPWIKPGAIVVDVGINRTTTAEGKARLVGDVAFSEAVDHAAAITPVPGGVGPMTIAMLLVNTLEAARRRS